MDENRSRPHPNGDKCPKHNISPVWRVVKQQIVKTGGFLMYSPTNSINVVELSPAQAQEFLGYRYAHDRPLRPWYVDFLVNEMKERRFQFTAEVHIAHVNGQPNLINGKHTCNAIVKFGKPVKVTLRKTYTTTPGQVAALYAFGHDNQLRRHLGDQMQSFGLVEETNLTAQQLGALAASLSYIRNGFTASKGGKAIQSPADRIQDAIEWSPFMRKFDASVMPCNKYVLRALRQRSVLSLGLVTTRYQPDIAAKFWGEIAKPNGAQYTDPRMAARRVIDAIDQINRSKNELQRITWKLSRCWRAFFDGEQLEMATAPKVIDKPITVAGCAAFDGKQPTWNYLPNNR